MSELHIALVAEGPTDYPIIEASLNAILNRPFIMTQLQPEATQPQMGNGWGGVLKWCQAASLRQNESLDNDPTLDNFDALIIHLDADVSVKRYQDCGRDIDALARQKGWGKLPCARVCPPIQETADALQSVIESWLSPTATGSKTILCLPAQSSGTWLAAAILPVGHRVLANAECDTGVEAGLEQLPKAIRIKKTPREYRQKALALTEHWAQVKPICNQAEHFEDQLLAKLSQD